MDILRFFTHYGLHFIFPIVIAFCIDRNNWKRVYLLLILTMLVDLDHLFSDPIFSPNRMSVGFHPLHSYYAIALYFLGLFYKKTRIFSIGLLFHMLTDSIDYLFVVLK